MAEIIYSAYDKYDKDSEFIDINSYYGAYDTSSQGWTKVLYLDSGVTITDGGQVTLYACEDIISAELPNGETVKIGNDFVNAKKVTVKSGGILDLEAGAVASDTVIIAGGDERVNCYWTFKHNNFKAAPPIAASSFNAHILDGGKQNVYGGYTFGTVISSGGTQSLSSRTLKDEKEYISQGIAENTVILDGGIQNVSSGGIAVNTNVSGGTMEVLDGGTAKNTYVNSGVMNVTGDNAVADTIYAAQNAAVNITNGTIEGILFATRAAVSSSNDDNAFGITITENVNTDGLKFCFDLTNMADRTVSVLNSELYDNLSDETQFYICNDLSENFISSETAGKTFTYSIISGIEDFNKTITIYDVSYDINNKPTYTAGNDLVLNQEVYDDYGNSYKLVYDKENKVYSVDFTNNTIFCAINFSTSQTTGKGSFAAQANDKNGLYSVKLEITDQNNTMSTEEKLLALQTISGTVKIYDNDKLIGTQKIKEGTVISKKTFSGPVDEGQLRYEIELQSDGSIEKSFTIRTTLNNVSLNKADLRDNSWQSLPGVSDADSEKAYIFDISESGKTSISREYVGFEDNIDYRRFNVGQSGLLALTGSAQSLDNTAAPLTITVYKAVNDGSKLKKVVSLPGKITNASINFYDIILEKGVYYLEVKSKEKNYINYDIDASVAFFEHADALNSDDNYQTATETLDLLTEEEQKDTPPKERWVGPGDSVDYIKLNIPEAGKYTVTIDKIVSPDGIEENNPKIKLEVIQIYNGKQKIITSKTLKADIEEYITKDLYISPLDNAQYFVRVTNPSAAKGHSANYWLTLQGTEFRANTADDTPETASEAEDITKDNSYLIKDEYIGYGDRTDYYTFEINESGEYSFSLESSLKSGAKVTVYRLYDDGKVGTTPLKSVISVGSPKTPSGQIFSAESKSVVLMEGTYYIKVTGGSKSNDSKNSDYSVKLSGTAFTDLAEAKNIEKDKTYVIYVDGYKDLTSDRYKQFTITQDNGKNKAVKVSVSQTTILGPGTYYLTASESMAAAAIKLTDSEKYKNAVISDDNSWHEEVSELTAEGIKGAWVGYGDGIDYYTYTVDADTAGKNVITFSPENDKNAKITLYYVKTDKKGVRSLAKASYKIKDNVITAENLTAGTYYVAVESKSYKKEATARNTAYNITVSNTAWKKLSDKAVALAKNEYAVVNIDQEGTFCASFSGENYTLYKDNGKGGLSKIKVYNNTAMLDGNEVYYVKSSADSNSIAFKADEIINNEEAKDAEGKWHLGLNDASDSYEFNTFDCEGQMTLFTLKNISGTVSANTKFTVTVYKEVNGKWKKVSSAKASYNAKNSKETAANLAVSLDAHYNYKVEVSTSDKGAGQCAGYFDFTQQDFAYDYSNNMFQTAAQLDGSTDAVVAKKGDNVDFYELDSSKSFKLTLDTAVNAKAAVKLTFYDENYKVVKVSNNGKDVSSLKLNAKDNAFDMASIDKDIKFVRVDAINSGVNSYTIVNGTAEKSKPPAELVVCTVPERQCYRPLDTSFE